MALFWKKNGKWILIGVGVALLLGLLLVVFKVAGFVGGVTATRVGSDVTPAVDNQAVAQATASAQARLCAVTDNCLTATPGTTVTSGPALTGGAIPSPLSTVTPAAVPTSVMALPTTTPNPGDSKIVQRIKNGERISVVYMGYGGQGHEGEYLTDTILVLSFDPKTQTVAEYNIPRDMYLSVPGGANGKSWQDKVNTIFSTIMLWDKPDQNDLDARYHWTDKAGQQAAAANLVANTVQNVVGFKIDYWVTMNFNAFRSLIDQMGGITVCVDRAFEDDSYPRNDNDQVDASVMTVKFEAGCQKMNGERAIQFARSRKSNSEEGGDFARSARQMKVIQAIKDEVLHRNLITNAFSYMDALQGNLRVSLPPDELLGLANYLNSADGKQLATQLKFDPEIMSGNNFLEKIDLGPKYGETLAPTLGVDKYGDIHAWVQRNQNYALIRRENVRLQVLNSTGVAGKANKLADFLDDRGFRQAEPDVAPVEDTTFLLDFTNGAATNNLNQLKQFLPGLPVYSKPADKKPYDGAPDLILYLGKDYKGVSAATTDSSGSVPQNKP